MATRDIKDSWKGNFHESRIDKKGHRVHEVMIASRRQSLNSYEYSDQSFDTLRAMSENCKVFIDHPSAEHMKQVGNVRSVKDWLGRFESVQRSGDRVFGTLQVRPIFWDLISDAVEMNSLGMSINCRAQVHKDASGKESIVDLERLASIDLVSSPALCNSLLEAAREEGKRPPLFLHEKIADLCERVDNLAREINEALEKKEDWVDKLLSADPSKLPDLLEPLPDGAKRYIRETIADKALAPERKREILQTLMDASADDWQEIRESFEEEDSEILEQAKSSFFGRPTLTEKEIEAKETLLDSSPLSESLQKVKASFLGEAPPRDEAASKSAEEFTEAMGGTSERQSGAKDSFLKGMKSG